MKVKLTDSEDRVLHRMELACLSAISRGTAIPWHSRDIVVQALSLPPGSSGIAHKTLDSMRRKGVLVEGERKKRVVYRLAPGLVMYDGTVVPEEE